jgi:hypothetical protein|tara:strand:- start:1234 stop:1776 length:543 start_codon:yes stop_codon:yes gene_type:complete
MNCTKCKEDIDSRRLKALPQTKVCVNCSTEEYVSCVDVIYHKTGNTIQIMDKESADKIKKLSRRSGFGIMAGMKGGSGGGTSSKVLGNVTVFRIPTEEDYQSVLLRLGEMIDFASREKCLKYVERQYESKLISSKHLFNLKTIIDTLLPLPKKEVVIIDDTLDEEVTHAFRNWKNSKIYR